MSASDSSSSVGAGAIVVPTSELDASIDFYSSHGFRLDMIAPADDPEEALLSGFGLRLKLMRGAPGPAPVIEVSEPVGATPSAGFTGPDGARIRFASAAEPARLPAGDQTLCVTDVDITGWIVGRAGLEYRDLLPGRHGGRFIASHIRVPHGGPVADYVHHHDICFQIIYCHRGEARLVYQDQGAPFSFRAGDCVLQPPHIRHRVLEASEGFEVIEVAGPARHTTKVDHQLELPNEMIDEDHNFGDQRFVHHRAADAVWAPSETPGVEQMETGIDTATNGYGNVRTLRTTGTGPGTMALDHSGEFLFYVVLDGTAALSDQHTSWNLADGSAVAVPDRRAMSLGDAGEHLRLLEVSVSGRATGPDRTTGPR